MHILLGGGDPLKLAHIAQLIILSLKDAYITIAENEELTVAMLNENPNKFDILIINSQRGDILNEEWWGMKVIGNLIESCQQSKRQKPIIILMSPDNIPLNHKGKADHILETSDNRTNTRSLNILINHFGKSLSANA